MEFRDVLRICVGWLVLSGSLVVAEESSRFGAMSYSPASGFYGYSNNHATREEAQLRAREVCEVLAGAEKCEDGLWFRDACGALAIGDAKGYGTAWDLEKEKAEQEALSNCANWDEGCKIVRSLCVGEATEVPEINKPVPEPHINRIDLAPSRSVVEIPSSDRVENPVIEKLTGIKDENGWVIGLVMVLMVLYVPVKFVLELVGKQAESNSSRQGINPANKKVSQKQQRIQHIRQLIQSRKEKGGKGGKTPMLPGKSRKPFQSGTSTLSRKATLGVVVDMVRERRNMREKGSF